MQVARKNRTSEVYSAINALADHLSLPPRDLSDWLHEFHGVPQEVLLSWICRHCSSSGAVKKRTRAPAHGPARGRARTARSGR